jgi:tight adherence protein C
MNFTADTTSLLGNSWLPAISIEWGVPMMIFVGTASLFYLFGRLILRRPSAERIRLERIAAAATDDDEPQEGFFGPLSKALAAQIPESGKENRDFKLLLRQAGLYGPTAGTTIYAARFVMLVVPMIIAGICAVMADTGSTFGILAAGAMASAILSVVPRLYVFFRRRIRMQRVRQGLADTIDMLSMCTSGGLGISESLQHVSGQLSAYPELAQELLILKRQAEVGSLRQALNDLTARVDLPEIRQLATLLTRGTKLGTQVSGSLNEQADHLRTARRQMATSRANKTPVKMVLPVLFCFAPAALILLTAPAVLELRDFLVPPQEQISQTSSTPTFGTRAIVNALDDLDQRPTPSIIGSTRNSPPEF